jgi:hypothetical protein
MKTNDLNPIINTKRLLEHFSKQFGARLNLEKYTREQLENYRNVLRTSVNQFENTSKFNESLNSEKYQKDKAILDILNAHLAEGLVTEADQVKQSAAVIQAAVDMNNKIKNMMEDVGIMIAKTMVALDDDIKETMGAEISGQFQQAVNPALAQAMAVLKSTKEICEQGVGILTGQQPPSTIGAEPGLEATAPEATPASPDAMNAPAPEEEDDFAASDAEAGGPELAGRAKRESRIFRRPSLIESSDIMITLAR